MIVQTNNDQSKVYPGLLHCTLALAHTLPVSEMLNYYHYKEENSFTTMKVYNHLNI